MSTPPPGIEQLLQGFGVAPPFMTPPPQQAQQAQQAQQPEEPPPPPPPSAVGPPGINPGPPDVHDLRVPSGDPLADPTRWGKREDGTLKGRGYLGILKRPDGRVSSEISMSSEIDGREVLYPLMVPTLTRDEVEWLLNNDIERQPEKVPASIKAKAIAFAKARLAAGKSPFALTAEEPPL